MSITRVGALITRSRAAKVVTAQNLPSSVSNGGNSRAASVHFLVWEGKIVYKDYVYPQNSRCRLINRGCLRCQPKITNQNHFCFLLQFQLSSSKISRYEMSLSRNMSAKCKVMCPLPTQLDRTHYAIQILTLFEIYTYVYCYPLIPS